MVIGIEDIAASPDIVSRIFGGEVKQIDLDALESFLSPAPAQCRVTPSQDYQSFLDYYSTPAHYSRLSLTNSLLRYEHLGYVPERKSSLAAKTRATTTPTEIPSTPPTQAGPTLKVPCPMTDEAGALFMVKMAEFDEERSRRSILSRIDSLLGTDLVETYKNTPFSMAVPQDDSFDAKVLCPSPQK